MDIEGKTIIEESRYESNQNVNDNVEWCWKELQEWM